MQGTQVKCFHASFYEGEEWNGRIVHDPLWHPQECHGARKKYIREQVSLDETSALKIGLKARREEQGTKGESQEKRQHWERSLGQEGEKGRGGRGGRREKVILKAELKIEINGLILIYTEGAQPFSVSIKGYVGPKQWKGTSIEVRYPRIWLLELSENGYLCPGRNSVISTLDFVLIQREKPKCPNVCGVKSSKN